MSKYDEMVPVCQENIRRLNIQKPQIRANAFTPNGERMLHDGAHLFPTDGNL